MKRTKGAFGGIEYVIIGTVILVAALGIFQMWLPESKENVKVGSENFTDNKAILGSNQGNNSYIATNITVNPSDISLEIGQTQEVTVYVTPSNLWTMPVSWNATTADLEKFEIIKTPYDDKVEIKALREGKALLNVRTTDGSDISKDVLIRIGAPITDIDIVGNVNMRSDEVGVLTIDLDNENATWNNKYVAWKITQGEDLIEVEEDLNKLTIKPKSGGVVKVSARVDDLTYDTSFEDEFTINIEQIWSAWSETATGYAGEETQKQYRSLSYTAWSPSYDTPQGKPGEIQNPDGTYKTALAGYGPVRVMDPDPSNPLIYRNTKYRESTFISSIGATFLVPDSTNYRIKNEVVYTQYGYQDVATWSTWQETKPGEYYDPKVQYRYPKSSTNVVNHGNYDVGCRVFDSWPNFMAARKEQCNSVCTGGWVNISIPDKIRCPYDSELTVVTCFSCKEKVTTCSTEYENWSDTNNDNGCPGETRTLYRAPATWGSATGWRTDTPYTQTTSRKPLTQNMYGYEKWTKFPDEYTECPNHVCPVPDKDHEYEYVVEYKEPVYSNWTEWDWEEKTAVENPEGMTSMMVESKDMYRYPVNYVK